MRVLITGAGGQVGSDAVLAFAGHDVVPATHRDLDVGDAEACSRIVAAAEPNVVVHAAAYTDVDGCETNVERAWRDNAMGTQNVALAARQAGAFLIALSTDYVYDGSAKEPYDENAAHAPLNEYGRSKAAGERAALESNPGRTAIVRSAWIYGVTGGNFVKTMLRLAGERETIDVVDDQIGSPTWSFDLAGAVVRLASTPHPGIFHVTNGGSTSWYGFAREVYSLAGLDPGRVRPITSDRFVRPAQRPAYSVLSDGAWRAAGFPALRPWHDALAEALPKIIAGAGS